MLMYGAYVWEPVIDQLPLSLYRSMALMRELDDQVQGLQRRNIMQGETAD